MQRPEKAAIISPTLVLVVQVPISGVRACWQHSLQPTLNFASEAPKPICAPALLAKGLADCAGGTQRVEECWVEVIGVKFSISVLCSRF